MPCLRLAVGVLTSPPVRLPMQLYRQLLQEQEHVRIEALLQYILERVRLTVTLSSSMATALK